MDPSVSTISPLLAACECPFHSKSFTLHFLTSDDDDAGEGEQDPEPSPAALREELRQLHGGVLGKQMAKKQTTTSSYKIILPTLPLLTR